MKELQEQRTAAALELSGLTQKVGKLHPAYVEAQNRIAHIEDDMKAIESSDAAPAAFLPAGQYFTQAEPILTPTSPKRFIILVMGLFGALGIGILAALLAGPLGALWKNWSRG